MFFMPSPDRTHVGFQASSLPYLLKVASMGLPFSDSLSVLVARGRAKVSAAAAASDWPKRIRDMQHIDVEDLD